MILTLCTIKTRSDWTLGLPDISIVENNLAIKCEWQIIESTYGSNHYPIVITIQECSIPKDALKRNIASKNLMKGSDDENFILYEQANETFKKITNTKKRSSRKSSSMT